MKRILVLMLAGLLSACQTLPQSAFSSRQVETLEQAGFHQEGENYELGLADRLLFEIDRSEIRPAQVERLAALARTLLSVDIRGARVEGHADATGSTQHNQELSHNRAEAVKQALVQGGLDTGRVTTSAMGETDPIASNDTPEGREQNRRVVVVISPADVLPL